MPGFVVITITMVFEVIHSHCGPIITEWLKSVLNG